MKYRKKPVVIEAVQFNGAGDYIHVAKLAGHEHKIVLQKSSAEWQFRLLIPTLEGEMIANKGDYIIKGVKGEIYPCKPDIFEMTYEAVL